MELGLRVRAEEIADGIITGVDEERGKVVILSCRALEILKVP